MMNKDEIFFQCTLQQGLTQTVGYIPAEAAFLDASVELPELGGFWKVIQVATLGIHKDLLKQQERNFKNFQGSTKGGTID